MAAGAISRAAVAPAARWSVLVLLLLSIAINLFHRQALSVLAPVIRDEFRLSNTEYSYIVFAFLLGMTVFQVPAGVLLDRRGARWGLPFLMLWWSAANALHAGAATVAQFCGIRFLFGAGACGNYSAGIKVIGRLFPAGERALAGGLFNAGTLLGSLAAPPAVVAIAASFGWRAGFLLPGLLGLLWVVPWLALYRDGERTAPRGSRSRLLPLFRRRQTWGVVIMRVMGGPVIHFYWYWLPEYLKRERNFSMETIGLLAGVPFFFAAFGNVAGGWFSGLLMRRGWSADRSRKLTFLLAVNCCAASLLVPFAPGEWLPIALISLATFGESAYTAVYIGAITDLFSERVLASLTGATGLGEGIANMALMLATGMVVDRWGYLPVFLAAGLMPMLGFGALMGLIRRIERVE